MKKYNLKELLASLSYEDQRTLVLANLRWMHQQVWNGSADGSFPVAPDQLEQLTTVDPETMANLDRAVETGDRDGSLKTTIAELVRLLPMMQKEATGPQINIYLKRHLPKHLFAELYEAAGLEVQKLTYDLDFPTEIDEKPGSE